MTWTTTAQASAASGVKTLVYAGAGEGKTVLCATAPKPVIISAEAGLLSLNRRNLDRLFGANNPSITYDIPVWQVQTYNDFRAALQYFQRDPSARQFGTICLDSISEIAEVVLANAKLAVKDPRQAYGELTESMVRDVKAFRDLPGFNVYMSAKMELMKDEMSNCVKYSPAAPGKQVGPALPYLFDEVFNLYTGKTPEGVPYKALRTAADIQYVAKDRSGMLDPIEMPNLTHVFNKIIGA